MLLAAVAWARGIVDQLLRRSSSMRLCVRVVGRRLTAERTYGRTRFPWRLFLPASKPGSGHTQEGRAATCVRGCVPPARGSARAPQERLLVEYDNARVLVTDQKLESIKDVLPLLEQLTRVNQPLLIIAEDVTGARPRAARCSRGTRGHGVSLLRDARRRRAPGWGIRLGRWRWESLEGGYGGPRRLAARRRLPGCDLKARQAGACDVVTGRLRMRRPGTHGEGPFQEGRRGTR